MTKQSAEHTEFMESHLQLRATIKQLNASIEENNKVMEQYWADKALDESIRKLNEGTKASADEFRAYLNTLPERDIESL